MSDPLGDTGVKRYACLVLLIALFTCIPDLCEANAGDFAGGVTIGSSYAAISSAPANGLIIEGNVGIGTASPGSALDIKGTLRLSGGTSGYVGLSPAAAAGSTTYTLPSADGTNGQLLKTNGSGALSWVTSVSSQWTTSSSDIYYTTGNVGIGTSNPGSYGLSVAGGAKISDITVADYGQIVPTSTTTAMNICGQSSGYPNGGCIVYRGNDGGVGGTATNGLEFFGGGSERMRVTSGGAVGIGTTSPRSSSKLDVNGTIYVGTFAAASGTHICKNGNLIADCSSARRFKEKIKPSSLGLKEVLAMQPVIFDFKDHKENWEKHDFGFIAEDMKRISPLFVTYNDRGELLGVRYEQLVAVHAKAIQELHNKEERDVQALKNEIAELKNMVAHLAQEKRVAP